MAQRLNLFVFLIPFSVVWIAGAWLTDALGRPGEYPLQGYRNSVTFNVPPDVVALQPRLVVPAEDEDRNGTPLEIKYCANDSDGVRFVTYIYVWTFSDTYWWSELLGYPDHAWDYEPVIVRVEPSTGETTLVYDSGHYRAAITASGSLAVEPGTHRFTPASDGAGRQFPENRFSELRKDELDSMNIELGHLPALPFGRRLSLDWACSSPAKVAEHGSFSTDARFSHTPPQLNAIAGAVVGAAIGVLAAAVGVTTRGSGRGALAVFSGLGGVSGAAAGLAGGWIGATVKIETGSLLAGVCAGVISGGIAGITVAAAFWVIRRDRRKSAIFLALIAGAASGLLSSVL